ncbi:hypothetical protein V6N13_124420 [Hibiscus sabdariffa]
MLSLSFSAPLQSLLVLLQTRRGRQCRGPVSISSIPICPASNSCKSDIRFHERGRRKGGGASVKLRYVLGTGCHYQLPCSKKERRYVHDAPSQPMVMLDYRVYIYSPSMVDGMARESFWMALTFSGSKDNGREFKGLGEDV